MKPFQPESIVEQVPQLKRGQVWCYECGHTELVNSGQALRSGWPEHCGYTMGIDSPEERQRLAQRDSKLSRIRRA